MDLQCVTENWSTENIHKYYQARTQDLCLGGARHVTK